MAEVKHHDAAKISKLIKKTFIERIMKNTSFKQNNFETVKCDSPSHSSVYCSDQASSLRSLSGLWLRRAKGSHDSMLSEPAGSVKAMHECSTVCGLDVSRPSLSKARYKDSLDYHRVRSLRDLNPAFTTNRSLRDLAPMCLRHNGAPRLKSGGGASRRYDNVVEIREIVVGDRV